MQNAHLSALAAKHEGLERQISAESQRPLPDTRMLADLKKQKLRLKEEMAAI
ncbi:YdcH family protein [Hephaestia sp. GCM10023244]|uniref:YdcH family protein n=1 Tax=unclassified Hephaestia TaxID=2631281 RepID=UPI002076E48B|nr:YdcH family protein [Hephaestia sp. MAHUQ-44]MCM8730140.1 YdcH family protein [Hephaestia sp. MAHUQ-44]